MPDPTAPDDPTDPALEAHLARLAPTVDPGIATTAFTRRRVARARRRRAVIGASTAAVVVLMAGLAVAFAIPGDDREQVLAGSTTATTPDTVTAPVGLDEGERRTSVEDQGLTLSLDTPEAAELGERLWVEVTLTNGRDDAITIGTAAPCHEPLGAVAGSIEAVNAVEADVGLDAFSPEPPGGSGTEAEQWSGDLAQLPGALRSTSPQVHAGRDEAQLATSTTVCARVLGPPEEVAAGASITRRIAIDLRWPTPESAAGQGLEVLAATGAITAADGSTLDTITVRQPTTLLDTIDRQPSYEAAASVDGVASAPTLPEWLATTQDLPDGLEQRYDVAMTWWNGAWEAWLRPAMGDGHQTDALRIRFDPRSMEVVDVRTVFGNHAPADDPAQPDPVPEPVDEVRYPAG